MRLRPVNFPTIRLSQFAALIHHSRGLFSKILEIDKLEEFTLGFYEQLFEATKGLAQFVFMGDDFATQKGLMISPEGDISVVEFNHFSNIWQ